MGSGPVFDNTVRDSRLREKDGRGRAGRDGGAGNAVVRYGRAGRQCRGTGLGNGPDLTAGAFYFFDTGSGPAAELIGNADTTGLINPLKVDVSVGVTVG